MDLQSPILRPADVGTRLSDLDTVRAAMEENFHAYEEVQALPAVDRDLLFQILWEAQAGDTRALEDLHELVYDEIPVSMEEFILSRDYLNLRGLINPEKVDILSKFAEPHRRKLWCAAGSGGGKSFMVSIAMAWMIYMVMCLKRPDLFYMLGPGSRIAVINLSVSKDQAKDVIFSEFLARLAHSPWFVRHGYEPLTTKAQFPKQVYAMSGGSTATSYYGYHTIMGSLDEVSFMLDGSRSLAEELTEALQKSLSTRFPRAYKLLLISTLRSPDDYLYLNIERIKEDGVQLR